MIACQPGVRGRSQADFLLFLNLDTELLPGCLEKPACLLAESSNVYWLHFSAVNASRNSVGGIWKSLGRRLCLCALS